MSYATLINIGLYLLGVLTGAGLYRLGIGLGVRLSYQIKTDIEPLVKEFPMTGDEQEMTD